MDKQCADLYKSLPSQVLLFYFQDLLDNLYQEQVYKISRSTLNFTTANEGGV
jgi:hypothetical protein